MKKTFRVSPQKIGLAFAIFLILIGVVYGLSWLLFNVSLKLTGGKTHSLFGDADYPDFGNDFINLLFLAIFYLGGAFVLIPVPLLLPLVVSYILSCLIIKRVEEKKLS